MIWLKRKWKYTVTNNNYWKNLRLVHWIVSQWLVYQYKGNTGQTIMHNIVKQEAEFEWLVFLDKIFKIMTTRMGLTGATVPGIWFWEVYQARCLLLATELLVSKLSVCVNSPEVPFQFTGWWFAKLSFTFATQIHIGHLNVIWWPFRIILPDPSATIKCNMSYIWDSALRLSMVALK